MADLIQLRRDTKAHWAATNPVLASGEPGLETDTRKMKFGNGTTAWNSLPYGGGAGDGAYDISEANNGATYATLSAALAAIPTTDRKGGMSIKYIDSNSGKYVQCHYINATTTGFTDISNWRNTDNEIDELYAAGIKVSLSVSPSIIYKGVATQITLTGTMSGGTPSSMKLMEGNTQLASSASSPIIHNMTVTLPESSRTYKVVGVSMGKTFNATASVNARYPLYYGFGANADAVAIEANRVNPTTSAIRTYTKTASTNGQHFYLLVPNDITTPSSFVMGGAPFVMNRSTQTINGISYVVFESGNVYNSGTELKIIAA